MLLLKAAADALSPSSSLSIYHSRLWYLSTSSRCFALFSHTTAACVCMQKWLTFIMLNLTSSHQMLDIANVSKRKLNLHRKYPAGYGENWISKIFVECLHTLTIEFDILWKFLCDFLTWKCFFFIDFKFKI